MVTLDSSLSKLLHPPFIYRLAAAVRQSTAGDARARLDSYREHPPHWGGLGVGQYWQLDADGWAD